MSSSPQKIAFSCGHRAFLGSQCAVPSAQIRPARGAGQGSNWTPQANCPTLLLASRLASETDRSKSDIVKESASPYLWEVRSPGVRRQLIRRAKRMRVTAEADVFQAASGGRIRRSANIFHNRPFFQPPGGQAIPECALEPTSPITCWSNAFTPQAPAFRRCGAVPVGDSHSARPGGDSVSAAVPV